MSKIVKIKQKDIEKIVTRLVTESDELQDLEAASTISEPYADNNDDILVHEPSGATDEVPNPQSKPGILILQREDGGVYAVDARTGEIYGKLN
jgi:hypothetical protein